MTERDGFTPESEQTGDIGREVAAKVTERFPYLTKTDRSRYDTVSLEDINGRVLSFTTETGEVPDSPHIQFIFQPEGFVVNYHNLPEPKTPYTHRVLHDSLFDVNGERWQEEDLALALEIVQLKGEGIDISSEEFRSQIGGYDKSRQWFLTMGERIDLGSEADVVSFGSLQKRRPDIAEELIIARIGEGDTYSLSGTPIPKNEAVEAVQRRTDLGERIIRREATLLAVYRKLLGGLIGTEHKMPYIPKEPKTFEEMFPDFTDTRPVRSSADMARRLGYIFANTEDSYGLEREYQKTIEVEGEKKVISLFFEDYGVTRTGGREEEIVIATGTQSVNITSLENNPKYQDMYYSTGLVREQAGKGRFHKQALKNGGYTRLMALLQVLEEDLLHEEYEPLSR